MDTIETVETPLNVAQSLADSEERYRLVVDGLSVGIWDWVIATNDLYWSSRYKEIVRSKTELKDTYGEWEGRLHPEDKEATVAALQNHLKSKIPYDVEYRLHCDDGNYVWIRAKGKAVWSKDGNPVRMVGSIEDITRRKESEAAIQEYVEKLKRSNQELDDFAYIASHDLKEPIRGLTNNAMFILEDHIDKLEESGRKRLNRMVYLCKRMEQLVDDLLYFSRLGRQELAVQQANLNFIISDIALMMETTLLEKNVKIIIHKPLPPIICDVPRVTEVFRNLITNAVKYNKSEQKTVEIGVVENSNQSNSHTPVFYVKDNGIGIEERFYHDIFRIFKRLNEEDENAKGTGVGLTFVKKIIERHGGKIWLESKPDDGTTFYFTLKSEEGT